MVDTSLIFNIFARDKTDAVFHRLESKASSLGKTVGLALGPSLLPIAAVGTGAMVSLGVALGGAGAAAGVFGAVAKTAMTEVTEQATKFQDLSDKVKLYGKEAQLASAAGQDNSKYLKKQADAAMELKARMANLPPETRNATDAFMQMKSDWQDFVDQNKPATFNIIGSGYRLIGKAILQLQPFFDVAASAAHRLVGGLQKAVDGGMIPRLAAVAGPALSSLTTIIMNVGSTLAHVFGRFGAAQGQGILNWIVQMTTKWKQWASAPPGTGGINKLIDYISANGPRVLGLLTNLAGAAVHIAQAIGPLAPISLAIASALASMIAAIPPPVITALVAAFLAFNAAMKVYAVVTAIATAVQWAMNAAWLANPITWIVLGIVALIAVIVLVATKTRFFQTIWNAVWGFMKGVGAWFAGPFANFFVAVWHKIVAFAKGVWNAIKLYFGFWKGVYVQIGTWAWNAIKFITAKFTSFVNWIRSIPGRVGGALRNLFAPLWNGFRGFINRIIGGWNSLHFGIPGFSFAGISVPGVNIGVPNLPYLARGAGSVLESGLAFIHRGESVTPAARVTPYRSGSEGGGGTLTIKGDGSRVANFLLEILREAIRDKGGDPVKVLSPRGA